VMHVYRFTNKLNGMKYVGATVDVKKRKMEHIRAAKRKKFVKNSLQEAIHKYGVSSFSFDVIDTAESLEELSAKEAEWIYKEGTVHPNGYNLTGGNYSKKPKLIEEITVAGVTYPLLQRPTEFFSLEPHLTALAARKIIV
jgi:group I intron endonuclease